MGDAELEEIRKARLAQLRGPSSQGAESPAAAAGAGPGAGGGPDPEARKAQEVEIRKHILNQILHPDAADRLERIRMVKEERAVDIENRLIMLARTGQLRQKVSDEQLKDLLQAVADKPQEKKSNIVISRRKGGWDDDDDDDLGV